MFRINGMKLRELFFYLMLAAMSAPFLGADARDFVLLEKGLAHGPYSEGMGVAVLGGMFKADTRGNSITFRTGGEDGKSYGPYFFTNLSEVAVGERSFTVVLTSGDFEAAHRVGRDTREMEARIDEALSADEPADGLRTLGDFAAAHPLFRNIQAFSNAWEHLESEAQAAVRQRESGRERFEGEWLPKAEVERRVRERHTAEMRRKGYEEVEGEWLTREAAAEKRLALAKKNARRIAEEERRREANKCRRCGGTGSIYYEIIPSVDLPSTRGGSKMPDLRRERPGIPPVNHRFETERFVCPDCRGAGSMEARR